MKGRMCALSGMMSAQIRRKFRLPVLSRLTQAWLSVFGVIAAFAAYFIYTALYGNTPGRISLEVEQIEMLARADEKPVLSEERFVAPDNGVRLAAPALRETGAAGGPIIEAIEGVDGEDILLYPEEFGPSPSTADGNDRGIVITIPGESRPTKPVTMASLQKPKSIADPYADLQRSTPFGNIPRISPDGRKAMTAYAQSFENPDQLPRVAIIVGGLGLNKALTERAIDELPPEISLAFAPYSKDLVFWTRKARQAGHEVLIELPMEGHSGSPEALGAAGLLASRKPEENLQRLDWLLSRFGGYFAATNYMGSKFSTERSAIAPVLRKLAEAGVAYIDDTGAVEGHGKLHPAVVSVSRIIPPAPDDSKRNAVKRELRALEKIAARDGAALGKTYAYSVTIDEIIEWSKALEQKPLAAAPASAILH